MVEAVVRSAGVLLVKRDHNDGGKCSVLVIKRCGRDQAELPKGRLEYGETSKQCARRELAEETGFILSDADADRLKHFETISYDSYGGTKTVDYFLADNLPIFESKTYEVQTEELIWVSLDQVDKMQYNAFATKKLVRKALERCSSGNSSQQARQQDSGYGFNCGSDARWNSDNGQEKKPKTRRWGNK